VVDDDPDALDIYRQYLSFIGMSVQTACDGRQAIERARIDQPHVIVVDISMPFIEGDDVAVLLKADPRTRTIPIIAISAFGALARSKARRAPFVAFCSKPLLPNRLATIIKAIVSGTRAGATTATAAHAPHPTTRRSGRNR
jgi:two-component system cell cycle response regulator DivK